MEMRKEGEKGEKGEGDRVLNPKSNFLKNHKLNRGATQHQEPLHEIPQVCQVCFRQWKGDMEHAGR